MLNRPQIDYLAKITHSKIISIDNQPVSILRNPEDQQIIIPYEDFRRNMGLDDLRWHTLCGQRNMIAGGAVLNWVWQENTNEDTDFFFLDGEGKFMFASFISAPSFKFHCSRETKYADTYFNVEDKIMFQLVSLHYGAPFEILCCFDFDICRWVADAQNIYTYRNTVLDLLEMRLSCTSDFWLEKKKPWHKKKKPLLSRVLKYYRKGFFLSDNLSAKL